MCICIYTCMYIYVCTCIQFMHDVVHVRNVPLIRASICLYTDVCAAAKGPTDVPTRVDDNLVWLRSPGRATAASAASFD